MAHIEVDTDQADDDDMLKIKRKYFILSFVFNIY